MNKFVLCCSVLAISVAASAADLPKPAEPATIAANRQVKQSLPFADRADFADADRGFIAGLPDGTVAGPGERPAWTLKDYGFLAAEAPDTVNPSLWRQAQLNLKAGLFKVTERIYQIRSLDISNMTIIEGDKGLIVIDPLTTKETATAGMALYFQHRPVKPVVAVIYSHSHVDHFGGVRGVVELADVTAGKVKIIAPKGFMEAAVQENVLVGSAMSRRAQYQFGIMLPKGVQGQIDAGLGKGAPNGSITLIPPTDSIEQPVETRTIDGVEITFMNTPNTEAPAEMLMYFPKLHALDMAELATKTLHNLLPFRGAEVRNADVWAKDLNIALDRFAKGSDVMLTQHNWPTWGSDKIATLLADQRDEYRFINDQTIRLINHGFTPSEIAEQLHLPQSLAADWSTNGYYGSLKHDSRAVYQRVLGWYDGNPANLDPLTPAETGKKFVEYMGGAGKALARARADYKKGEYRWVAQVTSQIVFADPNNQAARSLQADAFEQLGYQAETSTWRNAYLQAAKELRDGVSPLSAITTVSPDVVRALPLDMFFDYLAVRLDGAKAEGKRAVINWHFTDVKQDYVLNLDHSALSYLAGRSSDHPDVSLTLTRATLDSISLKQTSFPQAMQAGLIKVEGDPAKLAELLGMLDSFPAAFNIVTPN
jgi:alkyl sulfatase BDS1-like metallo-beta-lactamase superfamily hydrolase